MTVVNPLPINTTSISNTVTPTVGVCDPTLTCSPTNATAAVITTSKAIFSDNGKPATTSTNVSSGDVLVYQITVVNSGGSAGSQTLHDPVPTNTTYTGTAEGWSCTNPSPAGTPCDQTVLVGAGGTSNTSYTVTVATPLPANTKTISNTVTPTVGTCDPTCTATNPTGAVFSTSKVLLTDNGNPATSATQVAAADVLVYQITVTNTGAGSGTQTLHDPVPANTTYTGTGEGWSCSNPSPAGTACDQDVLVAAGTSAQVGYTVTVVKPLPVGTASISNTVTAPGSVCSPSCSPTNPTAAVLSTSKVLLTEDALPASPSTIVAAGDVLVYQVTVTNTGGSSGTQALHDPVPANTTYTGTGEGWSCTNPSPAGTACDQTLPVGANTSASVTYTITVASPLPANTTSISNTVAAPGSVCTSCSPTNPTKAVLTTSKILLTDNGNPATSATQVAAGDVLVYQITVTNTGGSSGTQTLHDPVPANTSYTGTGEGWSCTNPSPTGTACDQTVLVGAGGTVNTSYTVTVINPLPSGTTSIANTVTAPGSVCTSCSPTNPTKAVLSTSKVLLTDNGNPAIAATQVAAGDVLVYQITVTNTGGSSGTQTLHDPVPANTTYTGTGEGWSCANPSPAGTACDQTLPVGAGASAQVTYTATVANPLSVGTSSISNTVTPDIGICDPSCSPTNPTAAVLSTSKVLLTDDALPASPSTIVAAGDVLVYQITVTNTGGSAGSQALHDPVPGNTTYTGTAEGWSCATGSAAGTACDQTLPVGANTIATVTYTVTVANPLPSGTASIANTVTAPGSVCTSCSPTNATAAVLSTAKVLLTDNGNPATAATQVAAGDVLLYQITVTNTGGSAGSQALHDPVPANTTYTGTAEGWSCPNPSPAGTACDQTLPVGANTTATVTYTVTVANPLPAGTASISNTVTAPGSVCTSCSPTNATAAVLSTAKVLLTDNGNPATPATQVAAGDVLVYQITVTNTGGSSGTQALHDPVPANTTYTGTAEGWSCANPSPAGTACDQTLPVGANTTASVTYTVTVANPLPSGTASIANTVTAPGSVCSPSCSPTNATAAVLSTAKVLLTDNGNPATPATQVAAGDVLVYQITVTNTGGSSGTQALHDPVPANTTYTGLVAEGWSCATGSAAGTACDQTLPVGANTTASVTYTVTVANPLPAGTASISNTVTAPGSVCSPSCSPTNATAAVLSTSKVLLTDNGNPATPATQVSAGDVLVYQITVTNTGGSSGTQALHDPVPANTTYTGLVAEGWSCANPSPAGTACDQTLPVGANTTASVTYTVTVANPLPAGTASISNTVTAPGSVCSPSCSPTNATKAVLSTAKILLTDNGNPATPATQVAAGDVLVYQITVTNTGGSSGTQTLHDPVPANTTYTGTAEGWSCANPSAAGTACDQTLPVGANTAASVTYTVTVANPLPSGTASISNTVTAPGGVCTSCSPTNATAAVLSTAKVLLTDNGNPATPATQVAAGDVLVYQITVTNTGGSAGSQALHDPVPGNTTYTGTAEGWSCATGSAAGTACDQTLPVGANTIATVTYTVTVANPLPSGTASIANTVTAPGSVCTSCSPTNATAAVLSTAKVLLTDNGNPATPATQVAAGDVLVYQITVTNTGGSSGTQALHDPVPANTTYTGTAEGWSCANPSPAGTACDQTLPVGANTTASVTYTVTVANPLPSGTASIANTVTAPGSVCSPSCSPTNATAAVLSTAKVLLTDNGNPATPATQVAAGDVLVYQITVTNTGGSSGTQALHDPVPANTTYTGLVAEGWSCATGSAAGTACDQTLPVGANTTASVTYTVTVANPLPAGTASISNTVTAPGSVCSPSCSPTNATAAVLSTSKVLLTDNGNPATPATQVSAGDVLVYQITVTNTGGSSGTQALHDPVPANTTYTGLVAEGWSCANPSPAGTACDQTLPVGANTTASVTYTVTVANPLPAGTASISNTVTAPGSVCSPSCSPTNATKAVLSTAKILLTDNGNPATPATQVAAGDVLVYQITVTNTGGSSGTQTLHDPVPANTTYTGTAEGWSCANPSAAGTACDQTLPVGANTAASVTYTVTVANPLPSGTASISNTVTAPGGVCTSCSPTDPTVGVLNTVKTLATIDGAKATGADPVYPGDVLVYDIVTTNTGGSPQTTVLSETVPANTAYTGTGEGWSCATGSAAGTACTQSVTVAAGTSLTVTFTDTVIKPLPAGTTTVSNQVTSSVGTCTSCDPSNPVANPSLTIAKKAGTPVDVNHDGITDAGDTISYTFAVTNTGNVEATNITINDPKLAGVTCPDPDLAPGASETCVATTPYTVTAADVASGQVTNTATATGGDPGGTTATSSGSTAVVAANSPPSTPQSPSFPSTPSFPGAPTYPGTPSGSATSPGTLAFTGANLLRMAGLAVVLLGAGFALLAIVRRRRAQ